MAKHRKRSYNSNFQVINVDNGIALSTLAAGVAIAADLTTLGVAKFTVISADLMWTIKGLTAGEGPITVGIANGDLTVSNIGETLDANPTNKSDIIARERARRPVRRAGVFHGLSSEEVLNDGKPIRTKLRTTLDTGVELTMFARNQTGSTLTTGASVFCFGKLYGFWG